MGLLIGSVLEGLFRFFTYRFTMIPIVLMMPCFAALGVLLALLSYVALTRKSIVESLREAE